MRLALALLSCAAVLAPCGAPRPRLDPAPPAPAEMCDLVGDSASAFEGEGGLWVERAGDSLVVHWVTGDSAPGVLEAAVPGGSNDEPPILTPAGRAHRATVRSSPVEPVVLRYGASDRLHETVIDPHVESGRAEIEIGRPDSLFLVGDVHGAFDNLVRLLRNAGLVDEGLEWSGGRAHLAFAGDLLDRGPEATRVVWLVYRLEQEAARAGGRVHLVLGNHEIMAMAGDHRYVHPQEAAIAACHGVPYRRLFDPNRSVLGRWLATKPGILRIGDVLLAHGGVAPRWTESGLRAFDDSLAVFLHEDLMTSWFDSTATATVDSAGFDRRYGFFWDEESPFWFRAYVQSDTMGAALDRVLEGFGATIHAIGHTPIDAIEMRYGGRLIVLHPREFATEMVLIDGSGPTTIFWRYRLEGDSERLDPARSRLPSGTP